MAEERALWDTESGLIDDVDAWITNPHFGIKEEYSQVVVETTGGEQKGAMLLFDLADENGEIVGQQGYSIGTGWTISDDGMSITHVKRKNVVTNTLYGQLQTRVVKELNVNMEDYGAPTEAASWDGLGFHWNLQAHKTVSGDEKQGLMPTIFLGKKGEAAPEAPAAAAPAAPAPAGKKTTAAASKAPATKSAAELAALKLVAETGTVKEFVLKAMKLPAITADDTLMAKCLDDGPNGFYKQNKGK